MAINQLNLAFSRCDEVLHSLKAMLDRPMDLDRANIDATIQRFKYSADLLWKLLKRIIESRGKEVQYPKDVLKEAYTGHLIDNEMVWLAMVNDRNITSHAYNKDLADEIYEHVKHSYYPLMQKTFDDLCHKFDFK